MKADEITKGDRVEFDSDHGTQRGAVIGVLPDVSNGERYAVVEIDGALAGCTWNVPVAKLQCEAETV
jgi:hypothetical protein